MTCADQNIKKDFFLTEVYPGLQKPGSTSQHTS